MSHMFRESVFYTLLEQPSHSIFSNLSLDWFLSEEQISKLNKEAVHLFCHTFLKEYVKYSIKYQEIIFDKSLYAFQEVLFLRVCRETSDLFILCPLTYQRFLKSMQEQTQPPLFVYNYASRGQASNLFLEQDGTICQILEKKCVCKNTLSIKYLYKGIEKTYIGFASNRIVGCNLSSSFEEKDILDKNLYDYSTDSLIKDQFGYVVFNIGKEDIDG